jgi:hypothetical protein
MKKMAVLSILAVLTIWWAMAHDSAAQGDAGKAIDAAFVKGKCTDCHGVGKICAEIGKESLAGWRDIVAKMVERGADLNESEQQQTADFILTLSKGKNELCP